VLDCRTALLAIALGSTVWAASAIARIDIQPANDCTAGWLSVDVTVVVNGESFRFSPLCDNAFRGHFRTHEGLECLVKAGMCSGFWSENRFSVQCDDGSSGSVTIGCPVPG
jgi:hypothetical protein